jgi:regulation of enolase protein 1 (concanavalin A-like superfamily)/tetratricopeptide (TPR) repeat protein
MKSGKKAQNYYGNKTAIAYYSKSIELGIKYKLLSSEEIGSLYEQCGNIHIFMSEYENALANYSYALEYINDSIIRAKIYVRIAYGYRWLMDDIPRSKYYTDLAIKEASFAKDSSDKARIYLECSINYVGNMEEYFNESECIAELFDNKALLAYINAWKTFIYDMNGNPELAFQSRNSATKYLPYLEQSNDMFVLAESHLMLGAAVDDKVVKVDRERIFTKAIEYAEKAGHKTNLAFSTWYMGDIYQKSGRYEQAIQSFHQGWMICLDNHLLRPSPLGVSTFLLGNSLIDAYLTHGDFSSILQAFDELIDATAKLLVKFQQSSDKNTLTIIWERWNNAVVKRIMDKILAISDDFTDKIQTRWNELISNSYNIEINLAYHIYQMRNELLKSNKDLAKLHADCLLEQCDDNLEKMIPLLDNLFVYLLTENEDKAKEYVSKLPDNDFALFQSVFSYVTIAEEFINIMDHQKFNDHILTSLKGQFVFWMFFQTWASIQKFYEKSKSNNLLYQLADQAWLIMPELLKDNGISQLTLEPFEFIDLGSVDFDEQFTQNSVSSGWEWVDPLGDCRYELGEDHSIQIIALPWHDIYESNLNAPRLLREIQGNFILETCITDGLDGMRYGGLFIWKDENNYIRFETPSSNGWENTIYYGANVAGNLIHPGVHFYDKDKAWLRLERKGDHFTGYVSSDGENWYLCGWTDIPMKDAVKVGIHALCPTSPVTSTRFEYFKIYGINK